jgi:hypothetical protein
MLALLLYCAQHHADFCIPEFQSPAFKMCCFESADFQMSPSSLDIVLNLNILLEYLNLYILLEYLKLQLATASPPKSINCSIA